MYTNRDVLCSACYDLISATRAQIGDFPLHHTFSRTRLVMRLYTRGQVTSSYDTITIFPWDQILCSDYDLNIRKSLASVMIRVLQRGHSLVPFMMRSEQGRHMHKCLKIPDIRHGMSCIYAEDLTYPQSTIAIFASSS